MVKHKEKCYWYISLFILHLPSFLKKRNIPPPIDKYLVTIDILAQMRDAVICG
jgi:hypothetical protein